MKTARTLAVLPKRLIEGLQGVQDNTADGLLSTPNEFSVVTVK